jgi:predicted ATPase/class 3 adenylate cyclase
VWTVSGVGYVVRHALYRAFVGTCHFAERNNSSETIKARPATDPSPSEDKRPREPRSALADGPPARPRDEDLHLTHHDLVRPDLPSGTVTFLFTDVEGSTKLLHELGAEEYAQALAEHRRALRNAFAAHGGVEVDTQGDAFFFAFPAAPGALSAAASALEGLAPTPIRVRMGLHTGTPHLAEEGYVGEDVHLGARIAAAGHGGQVLVSKETRELVDADLTDLGEHRLKDFAEPVWIFQLGSEDFPPLKTISNTNLPRPASSFVGRDRELAEVAALLQGGTRLLTLTGPGGSGKTRLAIEAASELIPAFKAGVFWVGLATVRDPTLVTETVAQMLGAQDGLTDHIGERELLLLLDNLEQVVEAAPALATLVETCPNLRLLVTSRELLRVQGEVGFEVPPLADPEAVELFCARSGLEPDETIAELCRRLDSLPLAVELAAARTSVLSPAHILERLAQRLDLLKGGRDAEARQQTLRTAIAWSHELLTEHEQRLFARLAVFAGGCTLEAAEQITDADLDALQSLVDKSLVRVREGNRFWMLETIREYALEQLEESGEAERLRRRHADHFLKLAEETEPLAREVDAATLDRLEEEADNLRAALDWLEGSGETQLVLQLAAALDDFWGVKGYLAEGRRRLEAAVAADETPTAARAKALNAAGDMAIGHGDSAAARLRAGEALALNRQLGHTWGIAVSLFILGHAAADDEDYETARQHWEESERLFREAGDSFQALMTTRMLAWAYDELGESHRARRLMQDVLQEARAAQDKHVEVHALESLAIDAALEGRIEDATSLLGEAWKLNRDLGDRFRAAILVCRFARVLALASRAEVAARVLAAGEKLYEEMGGSPMGWLQRGNDQALTLIRAELDEATFAEVYDEGTSLTADEAVGLALESLD